MQNSEQHLKSIFQNCNAVLFCGSGISKEPPAGLPTWQGLRDITLDTIAKREGNLLLQYLDLLKSTSIWVEDEKPFLIPELVASQVSHNCNGYFESFRSFEDGDPNRNHISIAQMAKIGLIKYIVTTNFDTFIERALKAEGITSFKVYKTIEDFSSFMSNEETFEIHLFKIHGCISEPSTITVTIEKEAKGLCQEHYTVLDSLLAKFYFVFWGYSGADLKINPDYLRIVTMQERAPGFFWNLHKHTDMPSKEVSDLCKVYKSKGILVKGMLPELIFKSLLTNGENEEWSVFSDEEIASFSEKKDKELKEQLGICLVSYFRCTAGKVNHSCRDQT